MAQRLKVPIPQRMQTVGCWDRWKEPGQHALYKNIKDYKTTYISSRFSKDTWYSYRRFVLRGKQGVDQSVWNEYVEIELT
ncbi:MAG: hypothetical protein ACLUPL_08125 [Butyricimonas virosa]